MSPFFSNVPFIPTVYFHRFLFILLRFPQFNKGLCQTIPIILVLFVLFKFRLRASNRQRLNNRLLLFYKALFQIVRYHFCFFCFLFSLCISFRNLPHPYFLPVASIGFLSLPPSLCLPLLCLSLPLKYFNK